MRLVALLLFLVVAAYLVEAHNWPKPTTKKPGKPTTTKKPPPRCVGWGWWKYWKRGQKVGYGPNQVVPLPIFLWGWLDLKITWGCFTHKPTTTTKRTTIRTTPTTPVPTTSACTDITAISQCGNIRNAERGTGIFRTCQSMGNATIDAFVAQCVNRLCNRGTNRTAQCQVYSEFADQCNEFLSNSGSNLTATDTWCTTFQCTCPTTTGLPQTTPTTPSPTTTPCGDVTAISQCGNIRNAERNTGVFRSCQPIGNATIDQQVAICQQKLCNQGGGQQLQCAAYTDFAEVCQRELDALGNGQTVGTTWCTTFNCQCPTTAAPSATTTAAAAPANGGGAVIQPVGADPVPSTGGTGGGSAPSDGSSAPGGSPSNGGGSPSTGGGSSAPVGSPSNGGGSAPGGPPSNGGSPPWGGVPNVPTTKAPSKNGYGGLPGWLGGFNNWNWGSDYLKDILGSIRRN
jgi:hypothetical protein